ncbi:rhodanese-like domain-containing protein [Hymenobacter qilianensis]|uniref:rhodanese-like domain-containing protein n=1 Tax=Hymenobacter qilianensis TaxID=1385715 RepID=UPI00293BC739|nr:rhodanese-like domain-containing protein [Hymenobacter qilianensis]
MARASLLPRHHPIVVYCHHGGRSAAAITELQTKAGFTNLQNLTGGIHAWALEVDPTMPQY